MSPFNPFPGLRPFRMEENHLFFGREGQSNALLKLLQTRRFVSVVGVSGSGKSSLVRAGLLPALYGGLMTAAGSRWQVAMLRPGSDPIGNLAHALLNPEDPVGDDGLGEDLDDERKAPEVQAGFADCTGREALSVGLALMPSDPSQIASIRAGFIDTTLRRGGLGLVEAVRQLELEPDKNLLVVVDQFEELFRYRGAAEVSHDTAPAFVRLLLEASGHQQTPIYVVITMRSDFLGECSQFRELPEAINQGQYLIPRMTRDQRQRAIEGPVAVGGAAMTPPLVQRLLNDVGDNPDQLPILQHALMRTWNVWAHDGQVHNPIDLIHYEATGGMAEALSNHADEVYNGLPTDASRTLAEKIFKALTELGHDNRGVRRPSTLADLAALTGATEDEVTAVLAPFRHSGCAFLAPSLETALTPETIVDVSHESLMRIWERLRIWAEAEAQSAQIYRRLAETSVLYREGDAGLWRDPDLQLALAWREYNQPNEVWAQRYHPEFANAIRFLEQSKAARSRRRWTITGIALCVFTVLIVFNFKAEHQRRIAEDQKRVAEDQKRVAEDQTARVKYALMDMIESTAHGVAREVDNQLDDLQVTLEAVRDAIDKIGVSFQDDTQDDEDEAWEKMELGLDFNHDIKALLLSFASMENEVILNQDFYQRIYEADLSIGRIINHFQDYYPIDSNDDIAISKPVFIPKLDEWLTTIRLRLPNPIDRHDVALVALVSLNKLHQYIREHSHNQGGKSLWIVDTEGQALLSKAPGHDNSFLGFRSILNRLSSSMLLYTHPYSLTDGAKRLRTFRMIDYLKWVVVLDRKFP